MTIKSALELFKNKFFTLLVPWFRSVQFRVLGTTHWIALRVSISQLSVEKFAGGPSLTSISEFEILLS